MKRSQDWNEGYAAGMKDGDAWPVVVWMVVIGVVLVGTAILGGLLAAAR